RIARHPYLAKSHEDRAGLSASQAGPPSRKQIAAPGDSRPAGTEFDRVFEVLRANTGIDFSVYKSSTVERRVFRRMLLTKTETLPHYIELLQTDPREVQSLHHDLLINVTAFFRNPEAFEVLKSEVFPKFLHGRRPDDPLRIWVIGCSTGQEAFSLAMSVVDVSLRLPVTPRVQIFATDLADHALEKARQGLYPKSIAPEVSASYLRRFFVEE